MVESWKRVGKRNGRVGCGRGQGEGEGCREKLCFIYCCIFARVSYRIGRNVLGQCCLCIYDFCCGCRICECGTRHSRLST